MLIHHGYGILFYLHPPIYLMLLCPRGHDDAADGDDDDGGDQYHHGDDRQYEGADFGNPS